MSDESGEVSVTSSSRPDPDTIRVWDRLVSHTPCSSVSTALADLGRRHLSGLFVQPPDRADDISDHLLRLGFRPSVAGIAPGRVDQDRPDQRC